jgi:hypothetical protein
MAGWTARALGRLVDLPAATVASWVTTGLVTPEQYGRGRGGHVIGVLGLLELLAVMELRHAGIPMQSIRQAVENLRDLSGHERPLARLTLIVSGTDIAWTDADDLTGVAVSALHKPGQRLMIFPVGELHAEMLHQLQTHAALGVHSITYRAKEGQSRVS